METLELVKKPQEKKHQEKEPSLTRFSIFSLCAETGALIFSGFMGYFLIMRAIGLHEVFTLRYLNALFLVAGIALAMHSYKSNMKDSVDYKKGLQMGMFITLVAVLPFAVFIYLYLNIDDGFLNLVEKDARLREFVSPATVAGFICLEGICSGSIITFVVMQYFRKKERKIKSL
jgi:drug/metabolite transporter (DMT)-like permease